MCGCGKQPASRNRGMRWFQFRLRRLFLLTALVALGLPLWPAKVSWTAYTPANWLHRGIWWEFRWPHLTGCELVGWIDSQNGQYVCIYRCHRRLPIALARNSDGNWIWQDTTGRHTVLWKCVR